MGKVKDEIGQIIETQAKHSSLRYSYTIKSSPWPAFPNSSPLQE
jgi:hypothetical protein